MKFKATPLRIVGWIVLQCSTHFSYGQQEQQYAQYMINPYAINPAVIGTEDFVHFQSGIRYQWMGFEAAPRTIYISGNSTIGKRYSTQGRSKADHRSWSAVGGYAYLDQTGPIGRNAIFASYAYNLPLSANGKIRISTGMSGGMKQFSYDPSGFMINITDPNDPVVSTAYTKTLFDMNAGIWLYNKEKYFVGASSYQLLNNDLRSDASMNVLDPASLKRHYFFTGGYHIKVHQDFHVVPSLMIKCIAPAPVSYDINVKFYYRHQVDRRTSHKYWAGVSYRKGDSFAGMIGMVWKDALEISYMYEVVVSKIRYSTLGSQELVVGYRLPHRKKTICPDMFW